MESKAHAALERFQTDIIERDLDDGETNGFLDGYNQALADVLEWAEKNKWDDYHLWIKIGTEVVDLDDLKKFAGGEE